ncbi:MAG: MATE family efflux transporter [Clostridia bacterium]|nr:MATE family efflux transporter [Clostridia bacterium]
MKDMTTGSPLKIMAAFSLPMLLSMIFQQLYNISDSVIVGKFSGVDALAAVGASFPITAIFLAFATGGGAGCTVIISQLFGAKKLIHMKSAIFTALISLFSLSIIIMISGRLLSQPLMTILKTPENIFSDSALYLNIYIWGLPFLFMYNASNAVFIALGDSKTPLVFLIFSSLFNIALDLWLVVSFGMGVRGVAIATFIAQGISSVLATSVLLYRIRKLDIRGRFAWFSLGLFKRICYVAIPSILQQSFVSVGQLFVQGLLNTYGSDTVAGYAAALKVNTFVLTCIGTMCNALSSFVAQNLGANKLERVKKGYRVGFAFTISFAVMFVAVCGIFGKNLIGLFLDESGNSQEVLKIGLQFLRITSPFYLAVTIKLVTDAVLKGAGYMRGFMISTFADLILRVAFSYILSPFWAFSGIAWAYPLGWIIGCLIAVAFYMGGKWKSASLVR